MLIRWALVFFIISLVAGIFGFSSIAGAAKGVAKVLCFIFITLFLIALAWRLIYGTDEVSLKPIVSFAALSVYSI